MPSYETYWQAIRKEVAESDTDWDRQVRKEIINAHGFQWSVDWIRFSSVGDQLIWGWYCVPADHPLTRTGILWLPGYSYGTSPPNEYSLTPGASTFSINVHGNLPDESYINPMGKNDYLTLGIDDPNRYIYRSIACHCLRALDVLACQSEVDPLRLVTSGMSQGAMLALIVAAQRPDVRACFADMPFLSDIENMLDSKGGIAYRPLREYIADHPGVDIIETLNLFDPAAHALHVTCPVWLSAGGRDPSIRPANVEQVYMNLASTLKEYRLFEETGHDFVPEMSAVRRGWLQNWDQLIGSERGSDNDASVD